MGRVWHSIRIVTTAPDEKLPLSNLYSPTILVFEVVTSSAPENLREPSELRVDARLMLI